MAQCLLLRGRFVLLKTSTCRGLPIFMKATTNWRAGCGRSACPVRREGVRHLASLPLSCPLPFDHASTRTKIAKDNTMKLAELQEIYDLPFFELLTNARAVFVRHWENQSVQLCTLLSIKTGGCSEDCAYCAQSARYHTAVTREALMEPAAVLEIAERARANGSTRFCMGAAWKGVRDGEPKFAQVFENVLAGIR